MDIGDKIKSRRNELGFTLKEVADKLGVRDATVQRYESGNIKNLKQETISKLAEILNVKPEWLMGWADSIPDFSKTKRSTAKGVGRETGAWVQIPLSPPK